MNLDFTVRRWSAWAPGLASAEHWLAWAHEPRTPQGDEQPALAEMPALLRRRMNRLGRIALQASWDCQQADIGMPTVFASRYGDVGRSLALIEDLAREGAVSPTGFGLSVHNAIGAMYSIARGDHGNAICVAAGRASAAAGMVEAAGLLADGAAEVMLVCYDEALPADYASFRDDAPCSWAWAWRVARPAANDAKLSLHVSAADADDAEPTALPASLDVMRHFLAGDASLVQQIDGRRWEWRRGG
ncbi:MAG TPA: beta-ketoacyl synthase chain length factor [Albitalea sp.]|nr:beta-ketoacyl synthase chain length factor [Albitalea sp.]HJW12791.1 beta-ketoacyl synthase chain length factor [Albitalea sp.]